MGASSMMNPGTLVIRLEIAPDLLALHRADPLRYPCLLESISRGTARARYDLLFVSSGEHLLMRSDAEATRGEGGPEGDRPRIAGGFLDRLDDWWRELRRPSGSVSEIPFTGGWLLFLSYELAGEIEPRLRLCEPDVALPVARAERCPAAIIRDHSSNSTLLVVEEEHADLVDDVRRDLFATTAIDHASTRLRLDSLTEDAPERFLEGVARIKRHIRDGDIFQANLSRAWRGRIAPDIDNAAIYGRLRACNPAPFAALAQFGDAAIISSSPERLIGVRAGVVQTRPIAGTYPRDADRLRDRDLSRQLLRHPKERAEHIMLIDLERNDLGRICEPGSVEVDELMTVESYAHVHHIVSNIRGRLIPDWTPGGVIRAVFPGGTITGCPKVRCMEIIREIEGCARGAYTGAIGYLDRCGAMDLNILIRTLVRGGDAITWRAGAGIVADSIPARELEETRAKARGLLRVFEDLAA
jgi:anthranilate synthase component 1